MGPRSSSPPTAPTSRIPRADADAVDRTAITTCLLLSVSRIGIIAVAIGALAGC